MKFKLIPKSKSAFLARTWMIAFVTAIAIISLSYLMVQGLATEYDRTDVIDESFQSTYNKYEDLQGNIKSMRDETQGGEGLSFKGIYEVTFGATFTIISLIFESIMLPGAMLHKLMVDANVPSTVAVIISTLPILLITIMLVLVVISSISRGKL